MEYLRRRMKCLRNPVPDGSGGRDDCVPGPQIPCKREVPSRPVPTRPIPSIPGLSVPRSCDRVCTLYRDGHRRGVCQRIRDRTGEDLSPPPPLTSFRSSLLNGSGATSLVPLLLNLVRTTRFLTRKRPCLPRWKCGHRGDRPFY